jgi:PhzF family phenazine biosynthesis protein
MDLEFWIIDTFGSGPFTGAPAAVFLEDWLEDVSLMQDIAMEINTPETVFVKNLDGGDFELLAFTPSVQGMFLGNGVFAAAEIIKRTQLDQCDNFRFFIDGKIVHVDVCDQVMISMKMAAPKIERIPMPLELSHSFSGEIIVSVAEAGEALVVEVRSPKKLSNLTPNIDTLMHLAHDIIIVTADSHREKESPYDICARVFAPKIGLFEHAITPFAHAKLAAYWKNRIGKKDFTCHQQSNRPGDSCLQGEDDYVTVSGACSFAISGKIAI